MSLNLENKRLGVINKYINHYSKSELLSVYNKTEAIKLSQYFISEIKSDVSESLLTISVPSQLESRRWQMSSTAIRNTMEYIYTKLHHPCYLVGIKSKKIYFYKLMPKGTAPQFKKALQKSFHELPQNPFLTKDQIKQIKESVDLDNARVLQCIMKDYNEIPQKTHEYNILLESFKNELHDGLFLFNLTDAVILREDGKEPFEFISGDKKMRESQFVEGPFLPILSTSGRTGYLDIPIPNFDDIPVGTLDANFNVVWQDKDAQQYNTDWDKKNKKVIFRGGPSGCGATFETNMRFKLVHLSKTNKKIGKLVDACIVGEGKNTIKYDPIVGLTANNLKELEPLTKDCDFVSRQTQSDYKFIVHVDGNVHAYRLLGTMLTGSVVLRVKSNFLGWADHLLESGIHYVEIKPDLSDLEAVLDWCLSNDEKCRQIAENGMEIAKKLLNTTNIRNTFIYYLNTLSEKLSQPLENDLTQLSESKHTQIISSEEAIKTYYAEKARYESHKQQINFGRQNAEKIATKKRLKPAEKDEVQKLRMKIKNRKLECVGCGGNVGTQFYEKNRHLIARCGSRTNPCNLDVNIKMGTYLNVYEIIRKLFKTIETYKAEIIKIRMDHFFDFVNEETTIQKFQETRQSLKNTEESLTKMFEIILSLDELKIESFKRLADVGDNSWINTLVDKLYSSNDVDNEENATLLLNKLKHELEVDLNLNIQRFSNLLETDYKEACESYKLLIMPQIEALNNLKYDVKTIVPNFHQSHEVGKLMPFVEFLLLEKYNHNSLLVETIPTKVISFNWGDKSESDNSKNNEESYYEDIDEEDDEDTEGVENVVDTSEIDELFHPSTPQESPNKKLIEDIFGDDTPESNKNSEDEDDESEYYSEEEDDDDDEKKPPIEVLGPVDESTAYEGVTMLE
jgi:hypothetical protein